MPALIILLSAAAACAALFFAAAPVAEALVPLLPPSAQEDPATIETLASLVFFIPLAAVAMIGGALSGFNSARLGRRPGGNALLGLALGALGIGSGVLYAWTAGSVTAVGGEPPGAALLAWGSLLLFFQAAAEEVYFRGWMQRALAERWGDSPAVVAAALAFAALHLLGGARQPVSIANIFLGGLLFGLLALRVRGVAAAVGAHFAWNWCEDIGLGLTPNPGRGSFGAFVDLDLSGAALWGGSEEGLNGSLAMTLTLAALVVPLALLRRRGVTGPPPAPGRSAPARP
ncbi:MAG TPA: CPBP family glutamic-type intramembrane protease [Allosphingosinicella sp.]|jgi:hypothetical protein